MPLRQNAVNKKESSPALQPLGLLTPGSLRAWAAHPTSHGCSIISFSAYSPLESELPSWLQGWAQLSQTPAWWTRLSKAKGPFPAPKIGEAQASPIATPPPNCTHPGLGMSRGRSWGAQRPVVPPITGSLALGKTLHLCTSTSSSVKWEQCDQLSGYGEVSLLSLPFPVLEELMVGSEQRAWGSQQGTQESWGRGRGLNWAGRARGREVILGWALKFKRIFQGRGEGCHSKWSHSL